MTAEPCPQETELFKALREGGPTGELRRHAETCLGCADLIQVEMLFSKEAPAIIRQARPAPAREIWSQAQRGARNRRIERALRPILFAQRLAYLGGSVVLGGAAVKLWPALKSVLATYAAPLTQTPELLAMGTSSPWTAAGTLVLVLVLLHGLSKAWAEG